MIFKTPELIAEYNNQKNLTEDDKFTITLKIFEVIMEPYFYGINKYKQDKQIIRYVSQMANIITNC